MFIYMKLKYFILLLLFVSVKSFSQEFITEEEVTGKSSSKTFWERTYWGGDFGLMFGSNTSVILSPEMGYLFTDNFSVGGGIIYQYYSSKLYNYETTIYGGKVFSKYFIWQDLYVMGILEVVSLERKYYDLANRYPDTQNRFWFASPLVGIGYMQRFSNKGGVGISLLFNLNQDMNSPYYYQSMPIIRVGFSI